MLFALSRIKLSGGIDENTPKIVIKEIAHYYLDSSDYDIEKDLKDVIYHLKIDEYEEVNIETKYTREDLEKIAIYVSYKEEKWDYESLIIAFKNLMSFHENPQIPEFPFPIKNKSPEDTKSIDLIMLYRLCRLNSVKMHRDMTEEEMYEQLKLYSRGIDLNRIILVSKIYLLDNEELISIINGMEEKDEGNFLFAKETEQRISRLSGKIKKYGGNLTVFNQEEAIISAAINFGIDLSFSTSPMTELIELRKYRAKPKDYIPCLKDRFRLLYQRNSAFFDITRFWKPYLSNVYTAKQIDRLADRYGIKDETEEEKRESIKLRHSRKTFYDGIIPTSSSIETLVCKENIFESRDIISYGILDSEITYLTPEEIIAHLESKKDLSEFLDESEKIKDESIEDLIHLCKMYSLKENYRALENKIKSVKRLIEYREKELHSFFLLWEKGDAERKNRINNIITKILEVAMYMRGWKVLNDRYPLKREQVNAADNQQDGHEIDINIHNAMKDLEDEMRKLTEEEDQIIRKLPLYKTRNNLKNIFVCTDPDEGLTVFDRIHIVLENKKDDPAACRRTSSTFIMLSSYQYQYILDGSELFSLDEFEEVF